MLVVEISLTQENSDGYEKSEPDKISGLANSYTSATKMERT